MNNTHSSNTTQKFNTGRWLVWSLFALLLLVAPLVWTSGLSITMLSQMGIAIIACLSYNILLGQGGMLSFGHAVYTGLGSFVAIHASLMIPEFFGGEGGVNANRVFGKPFMGISFGPPIQVYYLIAVYTFFAVALMFAFTRTPLGRILNAVRDNPERVEFIGYNTQKVRYLAFIIAGFFAGISGGMGALNFEIVTAEVVHAARSGAYLLFTFLGGATFFFGPIIGAVLMVLAFILFSEFTSAWLLYLGLIFLFMVMYAPGGIASLIMMNLRVAAYGRLKELWVNYVPLTLAALVALAGGAAMIEMIYHLQLNSVQGDELKFLGLMLNIRSMASWLGALAVLLVGVGLFELARRKFAVKWGAIQEYIELDIKRKEAL